MAGREYTKRELAFAARAAEFFEREAGDLPADSPLRGLAAALPGRFNQAAGKRRLRLLAPSEERA